MSATIKNSSFTMNMQADGATEVLAQALLAQAEANEASSNAMMQLAKSLKPIDACAVRIEDSGEINIGDIE